MLICHPNPRTDRKKRGFVRKTLVTTWLTSGAHSDHLEFMQTCAASHEHCARKESLLQLREIAMAGWKPANSSYITLFLDPGWTEQSPCRRLVPYSTAERMMVQQKATRQFGLFSCRKEGQARGVTRFPAYVHVPTCARSFAIVF